MDTMTLKLDSNALAPFHSAWRKSVEKQAGREPESLLGAVQQHIDALDGAQLPQFVRERIAAVPDVLALLRDRGWNAAPELRSDLHGALAYLSEPHDLIPDSKPHYGLLDDALVLELALASHRGEWLAWREYQAFCVRHAIAVGALGREEWMALRRASRREAMRSPRALDYHRPANGTHFHRERHSYVAPALNEPAELFGVH